MKNHHKIPFKELKRHMKYADEQTERQEARLLEKEMKLLEKEKFDAYCKEQEFMTEKEREAEEAYKLMKRMAEGGAE